VGRGTDLNITNSSERGRKNEVVRKQEIAKKKGDPVWDIKETIG